MESTREDYTISTDKSKINVMMVQDYLCNQSYWAQGIPLNIVQRSIDNSLCFGIYQNNEQVGFARVISDYATFAYLGDVFVLPAHRGKGLSKWLMREIMDHPWLQGLRRFLLTTSDAHELYAQFGFVVYPQPERMMGINRPSIYKDMK
jgi:GNAT superfamily N-acetyltransferase